MKTLFTLILICASAVAPAQIQYDLNDHPKEILKQNNSDLERISCNITGDSMQFEIYTLQDNIHGGIIAYKRFDHSTYQYYLEVYSNDFISNKVGNGVAVTLSDGTVWQDMNAHYAEQPTKYVNYRMSGILHVTEAQFRTLCYVPVVSVKVGTVSTSIPWAKSRLMMRTCRCLWNRWSLAQFIYHNSTE